MVMPSLTKMWEGMKGSPKKTAAGLVASTVGSPIAYSHGLSGTLNMAANGLEKTGIGAVVSAPALPWFGAATSLLHAGWLWKKDKTDLIDRSTVLATTKAATPCRQFLCVPPDGKHQIIAPSNMATVIMGKSNPILTSIVTHFNSQLQTATNRTEIDQLIQTAHDQIDTALTGKTGAHLQTSKKRLKSNIRRLGLHHLASVTPVAGAGAKQAQKKYNALYNFLIKEMARQPALAADLIRIVDQCAGDHDFAAANQELEALADNAFQTHKSKKIGPYEVEVNGDSFSITHDGTAAFLNQGKQLAELVRVLEYYAAKGIKPNITINGNKKAALLLAAHMDHHCKRLDFDEPNITVKTKSAYGKDEAIDNFRGEADYQKEHAKLLDRVHTEQARNLVNEYTQAKAQLEQCRTELAALTPEATPAQVQALQVKINGLVAQLHQQTVEMQQLKSTIGDKGDATTALTNLNHTHKDAIHYMDEEMPVLLDEVTAKTNHAIMNNHDTVPSFEKMQTQLEEQLARSRTEFLQEHQQQAPMGGAMA